MKSIRKGLAEILTVLLVIGLLPVSPGRSVSFAGTKDNTASESNAFENSVTLGTGSDTLEDGMVANPDNGTSSDAVPDITIGTSSDAAFDQTVTATGYTIRVTADPGVFPGGSTLYASEITDAGKKETINEKVSEEAGKETAALISFDIKVLDRSGNEAEPDLTKGKPVVTFGKVNVEQLSGKKDAKLEVYHLDDDLNTAEKLKAEENKTAETVKAEAEHFSVFTLAGDTVQTYTVIFDGNGNSDYPVTGTMSSQSIEVGKQTALAVNVFSRKGFNFTGWNTEQGGTGTAYKNKAEVTNLVAANGSITLYAQWTAQKSDRWYIQDGVLHIGAESIPNGLNYSGEFSVVYDGNFSYAWQSLGSEVNKTITKVIVEKSCIAPTSTAGWFYGFGNLTSCDLSNLDTGSVTNMTGMFDGCSKLQSLDLSSFDTSKVMDMGGMFYGCSGLQSLNLSSFNTANVRNMSSMFYNCSRLKSLDLSKFDTSKVTDMLGMFYGCSSLKSLNLSGFNTASVANMSDMFSNCSSLSSVTFGQNFTFKDGTSLRDGSWIRSTDKVVYTSAQLVALTGIALAGTWTWQTPIKTGGDVNQIASSSSWYSISTDPNLLQTVVSGYRDLPASEQLKVTSAALGTVEDALEAITGVKVQTNVAAGSADVLSAETNGLAVAAGLNTDGSFNGVNANGDAVKIASGKVDSIKNTVTGNHSIFSGDFNPTTQINIQNQSDLFGVVYESTVTLKDGTKFRVNINNSVDMKLISSQPIMDKTTIVHNHTANGVTTSTSAVVSSGIAKAAELTATVSSDNYGGSIIEIFSNQSVFYFIPPSSALAETGSSGSSSGSSATGTWKKDSKGWWYSYGNGLYAANEWKKINGKWYHFNTDGYMQTGWIYEGGNWYYLDPESGAMVTGLLHAPDGFRYYFREDGSMAVGDVTVDGVLKNFNETLPPGPTYDRDPVTGEWKPNGSNAIPYGAEITA